MYCIYCDLYVLCEVCLLWVTICVGDWDQKVSGAVQGKKKQLVLPGRLFRAFLSPDGNRPQRTQAISEWEIRAPGAEKSETWQAIIAD